MTGEISQNSVFSHEHGTSSVIPIPVSIVREILEKDEKALAKFWKYNAHRMIFFNFSKCSRLRNHGQDAIKRLVNASKINVFKNKVYDKKHLETTSINLSFGGILFTGALARLSDDDRGYNDVTDEESFPSMSQQEGM